MNLFDLFKPIVDYINPFFTVIAPEMEIWLVFVFAFFLAYVIKSKNNWGNVYFILTGLTIFAALRYINLGN